jgi:hypothetical protein
MAVGFPTKADYATGDVLTAANMNDLAGTLNTVPNTYGFTAGKNKIINGDFRINQRAFTSTTTAGTYGFDRWTLAGAVDGTTTMSAQTFTAGVAPVTGYEAINFNRIQTTGQTLASASSTFTQRIEDVRTVTPASAWTVSFWAKAASGTPKVAVELAQNFGSGGSAQVNNYLGQVTLSTSWARYSLTITVPSISGKTIGTGSLTNTTFWVSAGSNFDARTGSLGIQTNTFDFWGVQVEAGSTASPFQTATGTLQGELAACQRYYFRQNADSVYVMYGNGVGETTTGAGILFKPPVTMRIEPTAIDYATPFALYDGVNIVSATALTLNSVWSGKDVAGISASTAGSLVANRPYILLSNNSSSSYIGVSAEL